MVNHNVMFAIKSDRIAYFLKFKTQTETRIRSLEEDMSSMDKGYSPFNGRKRNNILDMINVNKEWLLWSKIHLDALGY